MIVKNNTGYRYVMFEVSDGAFMDGCHTISYPSTMKVFPPVLNGIYTLTLTVYLSMNPDFTPDPGSIVVTKRHIIAVKNCTTVITLNGFDSITVSY